MITGIIYGIVASTKTRVRCVFCGVYIPNANKCVEEHINGAKHKENMELVNENGIRYDNNHGLYCKLCNKVFGDNVSILQHLQTENHSNWIMAIQDLTDGELINVEPYLASQSNDAYCEACRVAIPCTLRNLEEHVNEDTHIIEMIKPLHGLFPVDNPHELWCKICDVYVEKSKTAVRYHSQFDKIHLDWFRKMEQFVGNNGVLFTNYLGYEFENKVYCVRCKAEILCNFESILYHVQTDAHVNWVANMSDDSDVVLPPHYLSAY